MSGISYKFYKCKFRNITINIDNTMDIICFIINPIPYFTILPSYYLIKILVI